MSKFLVRICLATFLTCTALLSFAQDFSTAGGYLDHFNKTTEVMNQTYMNYLSAVSHGKRAKKVEKLRIKTLDAILTAKGEILGAPAFKGDRTYKEAMAEYIKLCYAVFNEDYRKIVDMEEIAEQSYDGMEAYLLAQKKAGEKLEEAGDKRKKAFAEFATKNNITIVNQKDDLDMKMEKAGKVNDYYDKVYLIFFKSYRQDLYLTDAMNKSDLSAMEQSRNALETYATEGLQQLETVGSFESDARIMVACKQALQFYKQLASKKMEPVSNFIMANENFEKLKKTFEKMPSSKRTQADVDNYNKAVNDINKGSAAYNKTNNEINKERNEMLKSWNEAVKDFMDDQMPYAK
jgi:hypothetical protein